MPIRYRDGLLCTGETYTDAVEMTSPKALRLPIRQGFSIPASTGTLGAIDLHDDSTIDEKALKAFIHAAATVNSARSRG